MKIQAKFATVCPTCSNRIEVGADVEWSRGEKARHIVCPSATATKSATAAPVNRTVNRPARKSNWRPCGYPGCNPQFCDECDGKGAGGYRYNADQESSW